MVSSSTVLMSSPSISSSDACVLEQPAASESVLERPAFSRTIGYTALPYVLRDSPQRSVQLAVWA
ncbi:hypothetical protein YC2023_023499 [Brassica napus]